METHVTRAKDMRLPLRTTITRDVFAGLTVAAVAVPQAMAYALIAGIKPEYGLYTAMVMTALGSLLGSSSHLINGPTNAISLVVFSAVDGFTNGPDHPDRILAVCLLAALVGLIQILIALLKLGDLTRYISESVVIGFLTGAGILIALGQVPNLLGLKPAGNGEQPFLVRLALTLGQGSDISFAALAIGVATIVGVYLLHRLSARLRVRLPELFLALIVVSFAVWCLNWLPHDDRIARLSLSGRLPEFTPPVFVPEWIRRLWSSALAIALLGLVESLAIGKAIAARTRQPLNFNRQCLAEGFANLGASFFQCMPGSGSLTRSSINYQAGAVTRLSGLVAACTVAGVLVLFAPLARFIPQPALAGILVWTGFRIVDRKRLRQCLRATQFDRGIALATAFAVIFISVEFSILIGIFLSFLFFVPRAAKLHASELVVGPERLIREQLPSDPPCSKLALLSLEGEMFFGAAPELKAVLDDLLRRAETGVRVVVIRLKRARNPDMVCLELLRRFLEDMNTRKVAVLLCGVRDDFARALRGMEFHRLLPDDCLFREEPTPESSTLRAVRRAYEILGADRCSTCPHMQPPSEGKPDWYYVI